MENFYSEIYKLKNILRKGWLVSNVADSKTGRVESDAEHTFSMALLAMEIMKKQNLKLNELRVYKMILVHELCEIDAGDHTPYDKITSSEKYQLEYDCVVRLSKEYDMPEILKLWKEFEENSTPEAKFVKKIDKLDRVMQSKIYSEQSENMAVFHEFYANARDSVAEFDSFINSDKKG